MYIEAKSIGNKILVGLLKNDIRLPHSIDLLGERLNRELKKNMSTNNISKIEIIIEEKYHELFANKPNRYEILLPLNMRDISELKKAPGTSPYYCSDYYEAIGFNENKEFSVSVYFYKLTLRLYKTAPLKLQVEFETCKILSWHNIKKISKKRINKQKCILKQNP